MLFLWPKITKYYLFVFFCSYFLLAHSSNDIGSGERFNSSFYLTGNENNSPIHNQITSLQNQDNKEISFYENFKKVSILIIILISVILYSSLQSSKKKNIEKIKTMSNQINQLKISTEQRKQQLLIYDVVFKSIYKKYVRICTSLKALHSDSIPNETELNEKISSLLLFAESSSTIFKRNMTLLDEFEDAM